MPMYFYGQISFNVSTSLAMPYFSLDALLDDNTKINLYYSATSLAILTTYSLNTETVIASIGSRPGRYIGTFVYYIGRPATGAFRITGGQTYAFET